MLKLENVQLLEGRAAVLAVAGDDAFTRVMSADEPVGYAAEHAVAWFTELGDRPMVCLRGVPGAAADLLGGLHSAGQVAAGTWVRFPRSHPAETLPIPVRHLENWKFLATERAPQAHPLRDAVVELSSADAGELAQLYAEGNNRIDPPAPNRRWFGIRLDDRLVACGADRSWGGIGMLGGVTVARQYRTRGLASALTATIARRLHAEFGTVALGVTEGNVTGMRVHQRLGFRPLTAIASFEVLD